MYQSGRCGGPGPTPSWCGAGGGQSASAARWPGWTFGKAGPRWSPCSPEGLDLYNTWAYRSVVALQRLEFVQNFADQDGNTITPAGIGLPPELLRDVRHLVIFHSLGEYRTEPTVTEYGSVSDQLLELSKAGLEQVLDKLATSLQQPRNT
jgi:hypothetical protein